MIDILELRKINQSKSILLRAAALRFLNRDYEEKSVNMIFYDKNER